MQAVRLAQDLSLHKEDSYYYLEDTEEAQWKARRRYVLWVCTYFKHKYHSDVVDEVKLTDRLPRSGQAVRFFRPTMTTPRSALELVTFVIAVPGRYAAGADKS